MPDKTYSCAKHEFAARHIGKPVTVRGMWMGDFLSTVLEAGFTQVRVKVEKRLGSQSVTQGEVLELNYLGALVLADPTMEEAQLDIAEVYGTVESA